MKSTDKKNGPDRKNIPADDGSAHISARFNKHIRNAKAALFKERLWPKTVPPFCTTSLFLSASWLGMWAPLPVSARIAGVLTFAAAAMASPLLVRNGSLKIAREEALERIEENLGNPKALPAHTLNDKLPEGRPVDAHAIWDKHISEIWDEWGDKLSAGKANFNKHGHGKYKIALATGLCLAFTTGLIAGEERVSRLQDAFNWTSPAPAIQPLKVQAWVKPPRNIEGALHLTEQTRDHTQGGEKLVTSQYGTMVIQVFERRSAVTVNGEALPVKDTLTSGSNNDQKTVYQYETQLMDENTVIAIENGPTWQIRVRPDRAPTADIKAVAPHEETPETLEVTYGTSDDHGITDGKITIRPTGDKKDPEATPLPSSKLPVLPLP